jgi:hypothetical protein
MANLVVDPKDSAVVEAVAPLITPMLSPMMVLQQHRPEKLWLTPIPFYIAATRDREDDN